MPLELPNIGVLNRSTKRPAALTPLGRHEPSRQRSKYTQQQQLQLHQHNASRSVLLHEDNLRLRGAKDRGMFC